MKSGFIAKDTARDELIAGTERGGELPPEDDRSDGPVESETEAGGEPVSLRPFGQQPSGPRTLSRDPQITYDNMTY
jgi:hypothetical protein